MLTPDQQRAVVATATAAPSVHNTQPWSFRTDPASVEVHADRSRALPLQDPDGRELLLSCGAASLHAELAVRGLDLACDVVLAPGDDDLVARLHVGGPLPATEAEQRLLSCVPHRHTDRMRFADWPVPPDLLDALTASAATEPGVRLRVLTTAESLELALLQSHAQAELDDRPEALAERAAWARDQHQPSEGLPSAVVPGWSASSRVPGAVRFAPGSPTDVVLLLETDDDSRLSWVRAGRALARVLLEATASGLVAQPATLAVELPGIRRLLRDVLAVRGAVQMVLRTGYPAGLSAPPTGRRPVEDVLRP
jgi:nitroreductase